MEIDSKTGMASQAQGAQGSPTQQPQPSAFQQQDQQPSKQPKGSYNKYYAIAIIIIIVGAAGYIIASSGIISGGLSGSANPARLYQAFKSGNYTGVLTTMEASVGSLQALNATYKGKITYSISLLGINESGSNPITIKYIKAGQNSSFASQMLSNGTSSSNSQLLGALALLHEITGIGLFSNLSGSLIINLDGNSYQCNATGNACTPSGSILLGTFGNRSETDVIVTNTQTSYSTYNGQACVLSSGEYNLTTQQSSGALGGQYKTSAYGNYSTCVSETYFMPLTLYINMNKLFIASAGATTSVNMNALLELNATSINKNANQNTISSQIALSGNCTSSMFPEAFAEYKCSNAQVGTNGVMKVTLNYASGSFGSSNSSGSQNPTEISCLTYTLNSTSQLPSNQYTYINPVMASGGNATVTLPCYNSQGHVVSPAPGSIFIGILYLGFNNTALSPIEVGTVQTRVGSSPISQKLTTIPTTIPQPSATASQSNIASCGTFNVTTASFGAVIYGTCAWTGGNIKIYAAGGNSGALSYKISGGPSNTTYVFNSTNSRCIALAGSAYLPAQTYHLRIATGRGGGGCGNAELQLSG